jgi:hypothetical protein
MGTKLIKNCNLTGIRFLYTKRNEANVHYVLDMSGMWSG